MHPESVRRLIDTVNDDATERLRRAALSRLVIEFGADLGRFDRVDVSYLAELAHLERTVAGSPTLRIVAAIAVGYGIRAELYEQGHLERTGLDPSMQAGRTIGCALADLDPFEARGTAATLEGTPREVAYLLVDSCGSAIESRAANLLPTDVPRDDAVAVREAACLALLVKPMSMGALVRQIWEAGDSPAADVGALATILEDCRRRRFITDDRDDIRRMYRTQVPAGVVALTADGRRAVGSRYRKPVTGRRGKVRIAS
ncbi:MAG TPA: hypothetical protein VHB02_06460 [Acidimicrobiales bacterium]|nr:hypothetical protein [Acidimicrobiales bacterium]